ncbi:TetR/AcrR family transcriptional regulator [Mycolicibacterium rufum]|uniref:TetR/AcrR family transcriptional regulator n=1 Tax=Mycolicibacterium rufum TaxID=318424 RepID=A0A9X3BPQ0_9MYCO|nr:TetR/AcrR family transcriptional regulator [Mycolicibacterium rufum]MCV7071712.1 TetR/AcrR family transcriptional regulator [Mycolicibacterium rufum]ULP36839.1 TetR/AcrR family transcriptional regulator [Mycolicibacterium rufum]
MRADARRNRTAVVAAAEAAYAERGVDVSLNEIARRAGVGNATLYRHFPDREALLAEVYTGHLERYCALAEDAAKADDPVTALRDCVVATCALQATNRGLADLLASLRSLSPRVEELRARHYRAIAALFRRAAGSGRIRSDASPADLAVLLIANAGLIHRSVDDAPRSSGRLVGLWLTGLVSPDVPVEVPPSPTDRQIRRVLRG